MDSRFSAQPFFVRSRESEVVRAHPCQERQQVWPAGLIFSSALSCHTIIRTKTAFPPEFFERVKYLGVLGLCGLLQVAMSYSVPEDALLRRLKDFRLRPPRDPEFRCRVWSRIKACTAPTNWFAYARTHPLPVCSAFAIALLVGSIAGLAQARAQAKRDGGMLAKSYVRTLDPRNRTQ